MTLKRSLLLFLVAPLLFFIYSCGNEAGPGYIPPGKGPGLPNYIKLLPARYVAQTNGCIDFYAEVHDETGEVLANIPVTFTNLSEPFGVILDRCGGIEIHTPVNTDSWGRAKITLMSTTPGFATILAQTTLGGQPRDRKTVLFSFCDTYECLVLAPSLQLDVDSLPGNGVYNESSDFIIFEPPPDPDDKVELLATVRNAYGVLLQDAYIMWGSDHAEAVYTWTQPYTDQYGEAKGLVEITPSTIRDTETHITVWAAAPYVGNIGAYNVVTLFLQPVVVASITVTADPTTIAPEETSEITALVMLNTGDPAPDGTSVTFIANCGAVESFAQTTDGEATVTYTAPPTEGTCRVRATANGVSNTVDVTVRSSTITILPPSITALAGTGGAFVFSITGGVPPYIVSSNDPAAVFDLAAGDGSWNVTASGDSFTANVSTTVCPTTVTLDVYDSIANTASATVDIIAGALSLAPPSATICEDNDNCYGLGFLETQVFNITGGVPPYNTLSSDSGVIPHPGPGTPFTVDATDGTIAADTTITLTTSDSCGDSTTADILVLFE